MLTSKELRIPETATQEDLEYYWQTVIPFGDDVLLAGYFYRGYEPGYFAARYHRTTEDHTVEGPMKLAAISPEFYTDAGHAIQWAINNSLEVK